MIRLEEENIWVIVLVHGHLDHLLLIKTLNELTVMGTSFRVDPLGSGDGGEATPALRRRLYSYLLYVHQL